MKQAYKNDKTGKVATCVEFKSGFAHFNIDGLRDIMEQKKFLKHYKIHTDFKGTR